MQSMDINDIRLSAGEDDSVVELVAWFMTGAMIFMVGLRLVAKIAGKRQAGLDDALAVAAMITSIGSTVAITWALKLNSATTASTQNDTITDTIQKASYASSILYFVTIWSAKLSTLVLMVRLCSNWKHPQLIWATVLIVLTWGTAAVLTEAIKCNPPRPWNMASGHCIDILSFWNVIGATDIATDILLIILPFWLFGNLQMKLSSKLTVIMAFCCRIVVVIAAICRLTYLNIAFDPKAFLLSPVNFYIATQVQQTLSVIVASAPALRLFLDRTTFTRPGTSLESKLSTPHEKGSPRSLALNDTTWAAKPADFTVQKPSPCRNTSEVFSKRCSQNVRAGAPRRIEDHKNQDRLFRHYGHGHGQKESLTVGDNKAASVVIPEAARNETTEQISDPSYLKLPSQLQWES